MVVDKPMDFSTDVAGYQIEDFPIRGVNFPDAHGLVQKHGVDISAGQNCPCHWKVRSVGDLALILGVDSENAPR